MNMTYKDTTFCTRNCANNGCHRNTKRDDFQPKENDWVAYCSFSKCEQFKEPVSGTIRGKRLPHNSTIQKSPNGRDVCKRSWLSAVRSS